MEKRVSIQVDAWKASDGTLHSTKEEADKRTMQKRLEDVFRSNPLYGVYGSSYGPSPHQIAEEILDNISEVRKILEEERYGNG